MRVINPLIPAKAVKRVAQQLVEKYPKIFMDVDDDGIVIGDGSYSIYKKLAERA